MRHVPAIATSLDLVADETSGSGVDQQQQDENKSVNAF